MRTSETRACFNRVVFTYEPGGWPKGLITGFEADRGFFVEYVMVWEPALLRRLLMLGLTEAWARGYRFISLDVHDNHPLAASLKRLAERFSFLPFASRDGITHYVRYRRSTDG